MKEGYEVEIVREASRKVARRKEAVKAYMMRFSSDAEGQEAWKAEKVSQREGPQAQDAKVEE